MTTASVSTSGAGHFAYLFEAKGIQRYVFDSGRLRDIVGASDLLAQLAASPTREVLDASAASEAVRDIDDLIGAVAGALGLRITRSAPKPGEITFSRRTGGAFCVHACERDTLDRLRALWRLAVSLHCPGLEYSDSGPVGSSRDVDSMKAAYESGSARRFNSAAELPPTGGPFTDFNPRTGRLTTRIYRYQKGGSVEFDRVDLVTEAHRYHGDRIQSGGAVDTVAGRFLSERMRKGLPLVAPRNLEQEEDDSDDNPSFPFVGEDRRIAVIHADLSGLGEVFQNVTDGAAAGEVVLDVAVAIESAIEAAAKAACREVLEKEAGPWWPKHDWDEAKARKSSPEALGIPPQQYVLPARPVLLGGDDITILVRADLAVEFAECLLRKIETKTASAFAELKNKHPQPPLPAAYLSACAGIAIINAGQPFLMANALAESLCGFAKKDAKSGHRAPYPSLLAFHNSQSTVQEHYEAVLKREMTFGGFDGELRLTGNPYVLGEKVAAVKRPTVASLLELARVIGEIAPRGRGKLIEAAKASFDDLPAAQVAWARWQTVLGDDKSVLDKVRGALNGALGRPANDMPPFQDAIGVLSDVLELIDFGATRPPPPPAEAPGRASAEAHA